MEQEVRNLLQAQVVERSAALEQIAASWAEQTRQPTASEIDSRMDAGRPGRRRLPPTS